MQKLCFAFIGARYAVENKSTAIFQEVEGCRQTCMMEVVLDKHEGWSLGTGK
jgi:hypothetical protein